MCVRCRHVFNGAQAGNEYVSGLATAFHSSFYARYGNDENHVALHHERQNRYDDLEMDGNVSTEDKWRELHDVVLESVYMT